jgi:hypothetical protein
MVSLSQMNRFFRPAVVSFASWLGEVQNAIFLVFFGSTTIHTELSGGRVPNRATAL